MKIQRKASKFRLTSILKDFDFTQTKILLFFSIVPNVDKLSWVSKTIVAQKDGFLSLEFAFELGTGFVHGFVTLE